MRSHLVLGTALVLASTTVNAEAPGNSSVKVTAGTLGIGVELAHQLPLTNVSGRLAWNSYTHEFDDSIDGISYNMDLKLSSITALLDWRPWGKATHLTAGVVFNNNKIQARGEPATSYTIGNVTYPSDQVGALFGSVGFDKVVPYFGLGWNLPVTTRTAIALDFGVVIQGSPSLTLQADGPFSSDPAFQAELERERRLFEDDISDYEFYPVFSLGIQRRF